MQNRIRIGFVIYQNAVPAWFAETIQQVAAMPDVELHFLICTGKKNKKQKLNFSYRLFKSFEKSWFGAKQDAEKATDISSILQNRNRISINSSDPFNITESDLAKVNLLLLDIIYSADFDGESKENLSTVSRYGLWYIRFGFEKYAGASPLAFWEVMDRSAVTGSYLLAKKNEEEKIIYEGTTRSVPFSVINNRRSIKWKSSSYFPYRIRAVIASNKFFDKKFSQTFVAPKARALTGNFNMIFLFARNVSRYLFHKFQKKNGSFTVFISRNNFGPLNSLSPFFQQVPLAGDVFYADPFVVESDDRYFIFCEEYSFKKKKANIVVIELGEEKKLSPPRTVLEKPYHLSYPFVFMHEGEYYMVPETSENHTVELYRAKNFPDNWEFVMNLAEGKQLIDVTLHFENGFWWMFANSPNHPFVSTNDQLFLFYSDDLFSKNWKSHPQNPIATHIGNCRPAGRLYKKDGKLFRPTQNNASEQYGFGLKFNEIVVMNENEYIEQEISSFNPGNFGLKACHHIDFAGGIVVMDGIPDNAHR
jgi:hypothetical protein